MAKQNTKSAISPIHTHDKDGVLHVISPEEEYRYWESQYESADKAVVNLSFDISYGPAYRHGINAFTKHGGKPYDLIDAKGLASAWENMDEKSSLSWDDAEVHVRNAYVLALQACPWRGNTLVRSWEFLLSYSDYGDEGLRDIGDARSIDGSAKVGLFNVDDTGAIDYKRKPGLVDIGNASAITHNEDGALSYIDAFRPVANGSESSLLDADLLMAIANGNKSRL